MANVNITVTPINTSENFALVVTSDSAERMAPVKLSIGTGQTYSTTDRCVLVHTAGSDFYEQFGYRIIKNILCEPIACNNVSYGILKPVWDFASQKLKLFRQGDGGSVAPTGPLDEAEVANATALGSGTMSCRAWIFY
jgi:hypothetical protein